MPDYAAFCRQRAVACFHRRRRYANITFGDADWLFKESTRTRQMRRNFPSFCFT
jgi:hypothetical protein